MSNDVCLITTYKILTDLLDVCMLSKKTDFA